MKVKLIKGCSYQNAHRVVLAESPIVEVDEGEGQQLLASGYFEQVDDPTPIVPPDDPDDPDDGEGNGDDDPPAGNGDEDDGEEDGDPDDDPNGKKRYVVQPVDFDKMKLNELKAYAAENEIDISGLTKKEDIKERLIEAINSRVPEIFTN